MSWEDDLAGLFEDLEQQAEGLHLTERAVEVGDRGRAEYAQVGLVTRLHASVGRVLSLRLQGGGRVVGTLLRVGLDWCLLDVPPQGTELVVRGAAVVELAGLADGAVSEEAWPVVARLSLGSVLREIADDGANVVLEGVDGSRQHGAILRVGADFIEVSGVREPGYVSPRHRPERSVLPFAALASVRRM